MNNFARHFRYYPSLSQQNKMGFLRYGLSSRAGKVKNTNDNGELRNRADAFHTYNHNRNQYGVTIAFIPSRPSSKYNGKSRRRKQQGNEPVDSAVKVGKQVENLEERMERERVNDILDHNHTVSYPEPRNHKKWHRNHRDVMTLRVTDPTL